MDEYVDPRSDGIGRLVHRRTVTTHPQTISVSLLYHDLDKLCRHPWTTERPVPNPVPVARSREDLHLQECAHAGRTQKKRRRQRPRLSFISG